MGPAGGAAGGGSGGDGSGQGSGGEADAATAMAMASPQAGGARPRDADGDADDGGARKRARSSVAGAGVGGAGGAPMGSPGAGGRAGQSPRDVFARVLAEAGIMVGADAGSVPALALGADARSARRRVQSALCLDAALAEKFMQGLTEYVDVGESALRAALRPLSVHDGISRGGGEGGRGAAFGGVSRRDSLLRCLLCVAALQKQVAQLLIEKIPEHLDDGDAAGGVEGSIPRMILMCFRWLEVSNESEAITSLLLDVLADAGEHPELVREIVAVLPEVTTDADNVKVYARLKEAVDDDASLLAPVLDVLSNMQLEEEDMAGAVKEFQGRLDSARAGDLPMLLRFLMQNVTVDGADGLAAAVRSKLRFSVEGAPTAAAPDRKGKRKAADESGSTEALVLDALAQALRFRPHVSGAFLKAIKSGRASVPSAATTGGSEQDGDEEEDQGAGGAQMGDASASGPRGHVVIDIWILLVLIASGGASAKAAHDALRRDVARGARPLELVDAAVLKRRAALASYFQALLAAAGDLCRGGDLIASRLGGRMYADAFRAFADSYSRPEVLGRIVSHAGSGETTEARAALGALLELATSDPSHLLAHASFVESVLDYLDAFGEQEVDMVYCTFARLSAYARRSDAAGQGADAEADAELMIVLRKQLSHSEPRYQRMGVIGVTAVVTRLAEVPSGDDREGEAPPAVECATNLLEFAAEQSKRTPKIRAFLCERLADAVRCEGESMHANVLKWIEENLMGTFETVYLGDLESDQPMNTHMQPLLRVPWSDHALWLRLDGSDAPIYVDLMPQGLSAEDRQLNLHGGTMLPMAASFRLMASHAAASASGALDGIDAVLGAPLLMPSAPTISDAACGSATPADAATVACSLAWAKAWMRELVAAFSPYALELDRRDASTQNTVSAKVICRCLGILQIESIMAEIFVRYPGVAKAVAEATGRRLVERKSAGGSKVGRPPKSRTADKEDQTPADASLLPPEGATPVATPGVTLNDANSTVSVERAMSVIREPLPLAAADVLPLLSQVARQKPSSKCGGNSAGPAMLTSPISKGFTPVLPVAAMLLVDLEQKVNDTLTKRMQKQPLSRAAANSSGGSEYKEEAVASRLLSVLHGAVRPCLDAARAALLAEEEEGLEFPSDADADGSGITARRAERLRQGLEPLVDADAAGAVTLASFKLALAALKASDRIGSMSSKDLYAGRGSNFHAPSVKVAVRRALGGSTDWTSAFKYVEAHLDACMIAGLSAAVVAVELLAELETCIAQKLKNGSTSPMTTRVSTAAQRVLEHDWAKAADDAARRRGLDALPPAAGAMYGAKGCRGATLSRLVRIHVRYARSTPEAVEGLVENVLGKVGSGGAGGGKNRADAVEGQPALCGATLATWIVACREEALALLNKSVRRGQSALDGRREDDIAARSALKSIESNAVAVARLILLAKKYESNAAVLTQSARGAGKLLEAIMRARTFLDKYMKDDGTIAELVGTSIFARKEISKATRFTQQLCADVKHRKSSAVQRVVPQTKRTLEKYVFFVKSMMHRHRDTISEQVSLQVANLKHKNLQGQEVLSQVVPPSSDHDSGEYESDSDDAE